jgi:hypothetical protein
MAYSPKNLDVFTAAFAGSLAGMFVSGKILTNPSPASYDDQMRVAGAFSQQFDTAWDPNPHTELDVAAIEQCCKAEWQGRTVNPVAPFFTPTTYAAQCLALIAIVRSGSNYAIGQGIISPPVEGQAVANIASLTALNDLSEADNTSRFVNTLLQSFILSKTSVLVVDGITVVATLSGVGRWLRVLTPVPRWTNQTAWVRNFATGNDENPGTAALPLKTTAEFTRRLRTAKYSSTFAPYTLDLQDNVDSANDSFQWAPQLESSNGIISAPLDSGVSQTLLTIGGVKTVLGAGAIAGAAISLVGNVKSTITRAAGVFANDDIIEFTSGPSIGLRVYISEAAGVVGGINPWNLNGTVPVAGNTFNVISLTKFGPQIGGIMAASGARIDVSNVELPGVAGGGVGDYEVTGFVLRFLNVLSRIKVSGGLGARVRWSGGVTSPCMIAPPVAEVWTVERGTAVLQFLTTRNIVAIDVLGIGGKMTASRCEIQGGCFRRGGAGATGVSLSNVDTGLRIDRCRVFDVLAIVPANPLEGGAGDVGACLIMKRGGTAQVRNLVGTSANAGTTGIDISEGSKCLLQDQVGLPSTATGALQDLRIDGGAAIPSIAAGTGLPVAGAAITAWAVLDGAPYGGSAFNLVNGTCFTRVV